MKILLSLLLSLSLIALAACGGPVPAASSAPPSSSPAGGEEGQQPAPAPFALAVYPGLSFHPALGANRANLALAPLLYEPLFQVDASLQAWPVLCRSSTASEDKLTWTFELQPNVTFSDGTPLTGEAVARALNTARGPEGRYGSRLACVAAVTGWEESVAVTLNQPRGDLPLLLDIPIALGDGERPAGTGPYVLSGTEEAPALAARADWWQKKSLPVQEILLRPVSRGDELILAFGSGSVTLVDVDLMGTNTLGYSGSYEIWDYPSTDLLYVGFNARSGPCRTAEGRRLLAQTIQREAIAGTIYAGHAVPSTLPVHPNSPLYDQEAAGELAYAPEGMSAWLEGLRPADRALTLLVNSENAAKVSAAQLMAGQLEAAGLTVTLSKLPFERYTAALSAGDFDLYLGEVVLTADFDLSPLLSAMGSLNYGGWYSEEGERLLAALSAAGGTERPAAASALFALLNREAPVAPICFKNGSVLTQWGRLSGLNPVRGNLFYQMENWSLNE